MHQSVLVLPHEISTKPFASTSGFFKVAIIMELKKLLFSTSMFLLLSCSYQQPISTPKEATITSPDSGEFNLEYEKFTLENGLEVILHVDRSDPIVALTTVVHAGSNREKVGRTGFAHFFEHMAFNDSENVPRGWNRKAIPDWGGQRNGGTWSDGTIYYEVVPKDAFDKILWIDSDRLGYMINTVTDEALEREKQVVKNEKRQRVDNAPYGYTQEVIRKNLYPKGHPYSWTVIGSLPDLQAATLEDLKEFYNRYYGASNATLSIVGDIDIEQTKTKVKKWFGEIRRGEEVNALPAMPVALSETKAFYFEDNFAKLPELRLTFPSVESYHKDEQALDILGQLLAGSKTSPLYQHIVIQKKLAPGVSSFNNSMEIAGEFVFRVRANANTDLEDVNQAVQEALKQFEQQGVNAKDLKRIKAEQETQLYTSLSTVLGKSNQLASDNEFAGNPGYAIQSAALLKSVTAEDVMNAYRKYIKGKPAIITSFVPKGQVSLAVNDAELASVWIEEVKAAAANEQVSQGAVAEYEKTPSSFARTEPDFGELPLVKMPEIWEASLPNNIRLLGIENGEIPLVTFDVTIEGGGMLDLLNKKGTSNLLARLMNEGTATKTPEQLEQAIGLLGSTISVSASAEEITISSSSLARNFEDTVALVEEILFSPRWQQSDFERVKSAALTAIKGREANPNTIARMAFNKLLYGEQHPQGIAQSGTTNTVTTIEISDLKQYYQSMLKANTRMHIAGNVSEQRAKSALRSVANSFKASKQHNQTYKIPEQVNAGKVFFIDVPGSKQSVINIGKLTLATTDKDANKLSFTNEKLGGGISGDLAQTLRIEKGYTYGAFSGVFNGKALQPFIALTSVRANATKDSLDIMRDMIGNYADNFSQQGVETTQQKLVKENTRAFESLQAKLNTLRTVSKYAKSIKYVEEEQQELIDMTLSDFKRVAKQYLKEEEMLYIIVGDKATQFEAVKEFANGELIELDIYGNPI
jgi:zinc protease